MVRNRIMYGRIATPKRAGVVRMPQAKPHRILFVRTDRMGDVLMNLPALRLLRQEFPKSWIALAVDPSVAPLLEGHPDLDEIVRVDALRFKKNRAYRSQIKAQIKAAGFSVAIASNPDKNWHTLFFLARIPTRVGYSRKF